MSWVDELDGKGSKVDGPTKLQTIFKSDISQVDINQCFDT